MFGPRLDPIGGGLCESGKDGGTMAWLSTHLPVRRALLSEDESRTMANQVQYR